MKLKQLLCLCLFAVACSTTAVYAQNKLIIETSDGNSETYSLKEIRKMTFSDNLLNITKKNSAKSDSYTFEDILKMYFVQEGSDIKYVGEESPLKLIKTDNSLSVKGIEEYSPLRLYGINGHLFKNIQQWDGSAIDISNLAPGTYILVVGNQPFKFIK